MGVPRQRWRVARIAWCMTATVALAMPAATKSAPGGGWNDELQVSVAKGDRTRIHRLPEARWNEGDRCHDRHFTGTAGPFCLHGIGHPPAHRERTRRHDDAHPQASATSAQPSSKPHTWAMSCAIVPSVVSAEAAIN